MVGKHVHWHAYILTSSTTHLCTLNVFSSHTDSLISRLGIMADRSRQLSDVVLSELRQGEHLLDIACNGEYSIIDIAARLEGGKAVALSTSESIIAAARKEASAIGRFPPQLSLAVTRPNEPFPVEPLSVNCVYSSIPTYKTHPTVRQRKLLWEEVHRVLMPGGWALFDEVVVKANAPADLASSMEEAANKDIEDTIKRLQACGYPDVTIICRVVGPLEADFTEHPEHLDLYQIMAKKAGAAPLTRPPAILLNWWDAYPSVQSSPPSITAEEVAALIRDPSVTPKTFAVIDVRRNDHAGGHVRGSFNWHAQTFPNNLPRFFSEFKDTKQVIFYCQSSNGRGPRCAGWYQDYLDEHPNEHKSQAYVLTGGIKNWLAKFAGHEDLIDTDD